MAELNRPQDTPLADMVAAQKGTPPPVVDEPETAEIKYTVLRVTGGADNFDTYVPGEPSVDEDGNETPTEVRHRITQTGTTVESKTANKIIKSALSVGVTIEKGES